MRTRSTSPRPRRGFAVAVVAAALLAVTAVVSMTAAVADEALVERHKAAGVVCAGCHAETPPAKPVATATCTGCHAYAAVAEKTKKFEPNPHASHRGEIDCGECHHVHKPSVDFCAQCHDFGFKAP